VREVRVSVSSPPAYERRIVDDELDELINDLPAIALEGSQGRRQDPHCPTTRQDGASARRPRRAGCCPSRPRPSVGGRGQCSSTSGSVCRRCGTSCPAPSTMGLRQGGFCSRGRRSLIRRRRTQAPGASSPCECAGSPCMNGSGQRRSASLICSRRAAFGHGHHGVVLADYVDEILASGLPGVRRLSGRARRLQLEGYVERIVDRDIPDDAGVAIRNPAALRRWMAAYAAASSTTATFQTIRDAASAGNAHKPQGTPLRHTAMRSHASGLSTRCRRGFRATTA